MSSKLDISLIPGIGLKSQIKPDTADLVQLQARFVQFSPNDSDLELLGISSAIAKGDDRCANNLVDVLIGLKNSIGTSTSTAYVPYTGATNDVNLDTHSLTAQKFKLTSIVDISGIDLNEFDLYVPISGYTSQARGSAPNGNSVKIGDIIKDVNLSVPGVNLNPVKTIPDHLKELYSKYTKVERVEVNDALEASLPILFAPEPGAGIDSVQFHSGKFVYNPDSETLTVGNINAGSVYLDTPTSSETRRAATVEYVNKYVNNTITKVLVFRGVVTSSDGLPVATNASVGDVYHLNVQVTVDNVTYEIGDELVCIESGGTKKWELLGRNNPNVEVAPIDAKTITLEWLESA